MITNKIVLFIECIFKDKIPKFFLSVMHMDDYKCYGLTCGIRG